MRPDLRFSPPSGSALPSGPVAISWTAPAGILALNVLAGTLPGTPDLLGLTAVPSGSPIEFTVPSGATPRIYLSGFIGSGSNAYAYAPTYSVLDAALPVETAIRRLIERLWLDEWLGADRTERRFCPAATPDDVSFDPQDDADCYPWLSSEATDPELGVGFTALRLRELDRRDDGLTAGISTSGQIESGEYRILQADFVLSIPSKRSRALDILESRAAAIEATFRGLTIDYPGPPVTCIRQLARYPIRRRAGADDGTWRRLLLNIPLEIRTIQAHAGLQEVALP